MADLTITLARENKMETKTENGAELGLMKRVANLENDIKHFELHLRMKQAQVDRMFTKNSKLAASIMDILTAVSEEQGGMYELSKVIKDRLYPDVETGDEPCYVCGL